MNIVRNIFIRIFYSLDLKLANTGEEGAFSVWIISKILRLFRLLTHKWLAGGKKYQFI